MPPPTSLFQDALFTAPAQGPNPAAIFAMSDAMRHYADTEIAGQVRKLGVHRALLEALYRKDQLKLEYDAARTRNAAEAFDARTGNCLSLVIMTAAFAKYLNLPVDYQSVVTDTTWTRSRDTYFGSGHVNLVLGVRMADWGHTSESRRDWVIDFLPGSDLRGQRSRPIREDTVVAMYMNNRAAEALAAGDPNEAYWWVRGAIQSAPDFLTAYNTLGVVYLRHGQPAAAEAALRKVLQDAPSHIVAMSNLVRVLTAQGRTAESQALATTLAQIESAPPYYFFDQAQAAFQLGDYDAARSLFKKEIARAPYHHEFHYWLAVTNLRLGRTAEAREQLDIAIETSTTRDDRRIYAAKLDRLRSQGLH